MSSRKAAAFLAPMSTALLILAKWFGKTQLALSFQAPVLQARGFIHPSPLISYSPWVFYLRTKKASIFPAFASTVLLPIAVSFQVDA